MSKRILASCVCAFGALFSSVTARAQSSASAFDGYTPGQAMPGNPTGTIALSGFEALNLANGQLSINIPLLAVHGRGSVSVPLSVPLNGDVWDATAVQYSYNCGQYGCQTAYGYVVSSAGWASLPPVFGTGRMLFRSGGDYCLGSGSTQQWNTVLTRATFVAPDGTETEFIDQQTGGTAEPGSTGYNRGTVFNADDGSFSKFTSSSSIADPTRCGAQSWGASGVLVLRDGTTYTISNGYVTSIRDRNGNLTSFTSSSITDPLGRIYNISPTQIRYPAAGGGQRTITIKRAFLDQVLASGKSIETFGQLWPSIPSSAQGSNLTTTYDPNDRVSEIDLPDGSKYLFLYDSYGDVAQITLPTGGVLQYDYNGSIAGAAASPATMYVMTRTLSERREKLGGNLVAKVDYTGNTISRYDAGGNLLAKETFTIANGGTLPTSGTNYNPPQYN